MSASKGYNERTRKKFASNSLFDDVDPTACQDITVSGGALIDGQCRDMTGYRRWWRQIGGSASRRGVL